MTSDVRGPAALLHELDPEARRRGVQQLGEANGPEAIDWVLVALGDVDWRVRKEAATVAASIEPRATVIERLLGALREQTNVGLRNAAVEALIAIGTDSVPGAIRGLVELDADGRKLAVEVLGGVPDLAGTRALTRALVDEDANVRAAAAEALGTAGRAGSEAHGLAISALTSALSTADPLGRLAALQSLTQLEADLAWEIFEPLTRDPLLRRHAIRAAGRTHDVKAVAALARAIGDRSVAVARDALAALIDCLGAAADKEELARVARREIRAMPHVEERIRAFAHSIDDSRLRGAALVALGLLRVRSDVPELVRGLSDEDVAARAELALRWFGQDAVSSLLEEGRKAAAPLRAATLSLVPLLTEGADGGALEALREALRATDSDVLTAAIQGLAVAGDGADLAAVAAHATNADARVSATACAALTTIASRHPGPSRALAETIPPDSPAAVVGCLLRGASLRPGALAAGAQPDRTESADIAFFRGALDHGDVHVRRAAVDGLAAIGGPTAAGVVAAALADEEHDVVLAAVRAMGRIGQAEPLVALLEGGHAAAVVAAALRALGEASPSRAFDAAWPLLRSDDPLLASAAVETIGQQRGARREQGLFLALDHRDPDVVKSALVELSRDMSQRTLERVGACLDCASYEVRRFAAELLGATEDPGARALVRARLDREADPVVREALAQALGARSTRGGAT